MEEKSFELSDLWRPSISIVKAETIHLIIHKIAKLAQIAKDWTACSVNFYSIGPDALAG